MTAFNFITMTAYSGQNATLETAHSDMPAFATFRQLREAGYSVNKGAKSIAIFCGYREKSVGNGKTETVPTWGRVFEIGDTNAAEDPAFIAFLKKEIKAGKIKQFAKV